MVKVKDWRGFHGSLRMEGAWNGGLWCFMLGKLFFKYYPWYVPCCFFHCHFSCVAVSSAIKPDQSVIPSRLSFLIKMM